MTILDEIVSYKNDEVNRLKKRLHISDLLEKIKSLDAPRSFLEKISKDQAFHFICEVKKASPSKGIIQPDFNPIKQARLYEQNGASAVSVLTDEKYFMGHLDHLCEVRATINLPVLRKDFIIDPVQIYQARSAGADMILLIARILDRSQLEEYLHCARELNMEILLELADSGEIEQLPDDLRSVIIGINNRNLHTFEVKLETSLEVKKHLPDNIPVISESGIKDSTDCQLLQDNGFAGVLIGETLMKSVDPGKTLREMKSAVTS